MLHISTQRKKNSFSISFGGNSSKDVAENERANEIEDGDGDGEATNDAQSSHEFAVTVKTVRLTHIYALERAKRTGLGQGCQEACRRDEEATNGHGQVQEVEGLCWVPSSRRRRVWHPPPAAP